MVAALSLAVSPAVSHDAFVATMGAFPTGVTIVTSIDEDGHPRGLTCNAFSSVSADPPLLMVCLDRRSTSLDVILERGGFAVNFLTADSAAIADRFASRMRDRFLGIRWEPSDNGLPILVDFAMAYAACRVVQVVDAGDHTILIGLIEEAQPPSPASEPLVYFRRGYGIVQRTERRSGGQPSQPPRALPVPPRHED